MNLATWRDLLRCVAVLNVIANLCDRLPKVIHIQPSPFQQLLNMSRFALNNALPLTGFKFSAVDED